MLVPLYFIHDHAYNFKWKIQWNRFEENKTNMTLPWSTSHHKSRILAQKFVKTASVHLRKQYQICFNILKFDFHLRFPVQISSSDIPWCYQWITFSEIKERKSVWNWFIYIYPRSYLSSYWDTYFFSHKRSSYFKKVFFPDSNTFSEKVCLWKSWNSN